VPHELNSDERSKAPKIGVDLMRELRESDSREILPYLPEMDYLGCAASIPLSLRCAGVMGVGAPVNGSPPLAVFGNAITSRIESEPERSAHTRSIPSAIPPWGGGP
jgi:hypothetical protein